MNRKRNEYLAVILAVFLMSNIGNAQYDISPGKIKPDGFGGYDVYDNSLDISPGKIKSDGFGGFDIYGN